MRKTVKVLSTLFISLLLAAVLTVPASAAIGYTASPVLPDNQRSDVFAYFDLDTQPGQRQDLTVMVSNGSDEEITVMVEALAASTNRNGDVVYVPIEDLRVTPKHSLTDMIEFPESRVVIPASSGQEITFTLTIPDEQFDGIVLGSVRVLRVLSDAEANAGGIVNQYAYNIPIRLHQSSADIEPNFYLESVEAELIHFSASIVCNIVNPQPKLIKGMTVTAKIYPEGSDTPILEYAGEDVSMAPESHMPLTIKKQVAGGFPDGNYVARITLQYEDGEWNLEKNFEITGEEAASINERVIVSEEKTALPLWTIVLIIVGVVVILAVVIASIFFRKHIKKYKEMAAKLEAMPAYQTSTPSSVEKNTEGKDVENE